jgi:hypothetical protein
VALAPGTLQRALFPPERMDVGVTLVDVEEFVGSVSKVEMVTPMPLICKVFDVSTLFQTKNLIGF